MIMHARVCEAYKDVREPGSRQHVDAHVDDGHDMHSALNHYSLVSYSLLKSEPIKYN